MNIEKTFLSLRDFMKQYANPNAKPGPVAVTCHRIDVFYYLEKDCSYTEHPIPGTTMSFLLNNEDEGRVVGISTTDASRVIVDHEHNKLVYSAPQPPNVSVLTPVEGTRICLYKTGAAGNVIAGFEIRGISEIHQQPEVEVS